MGCGLVLLLGAPLAILQQIGSGNPDWTIVAILAFLFVCALAVVVMKVRRRA